MKKIWLAVVALSVLAFFVTACGSSLNVATIYTSENIIALYTLPEKIPFENYCKTAFGERFVVIGSEPYGTNQTTYRIESLDSDRTGWVNPTDLRLLKAISYNGWH
jgi:hypothetical protein